MPFFLPWLLKTLFWEVKFFFAHNSKSKGNIKKHYRVDPPLFGLKNSNKVLFCYFWQYRQPLIYESFGTLDHYVS